MKTSKLLAAVVSMVSLVAVGCAADTTDDASNDDTVETTKTDSALRKCAHGYHHPFSRSGKEIVNKCVRNGSDDIIEG